MQIVSELFVKDDEGMYTDEITEGCEWALEKGAKAVATRKWDGLLTMIREGKLYRRHDLKRSKPDDDGEGEFPTPPIGWTKIDDPDQVEGDVCRGWRPVGNGPEDRHFADAFRYSKAANVGDGTYELVGPKVKKNPENMRKHLLIKHGAHVFHDMPKTFKKIAEWLELQNVEGVVWVNPDGRMAKADRSGFGMERKRKEQPARKAR